MKRLFLCAALVLIAAGCSHNQPTEPQSTPATQASARPINTRCPVHPNDEVDPKVTYLYQGKVIGFCCKDCIDDFKEDPAKYMKDLK